MTSEHFVSCPWIGPGGMPKYSARPFMTRLSGGAYRAVGAPDISTVASAELIGTAGRHFIHELPLSHPALDLRRRGTADVIEADVDPFHVAQGLRASIEVWLDAVEHLGGVGARGHAVEPSAILNALREVEDGREREAPDSLVYRIARDDQGRLAALCSDPRVMLRRERQLCPLGRVRELDASCMRWLDMQPGRTIAEKAGRKQQIRSIVRVRSPATLENRVLRDLLIRARAAGEGYCRENSRFLKSTRVAAVRRFVREIASAYEASVITSVPALSGVPTPNYVLQNDRRYRHVWKTWIALLRKQQLTQSLLWWGGRWVSELALLGALEALETWEGASAAYQHRLIWRPEPHQGEFFESGAPIGAYLVQKPRGEGMKVDIARSGQLARGTWPKAWQPWVELIPDLAIVPSARTGRPLLIWSVLVCDAVQEREVESLYSALSKLLTSISAHGLVLQLGGTGSSAVRPGLQVERLERATRAPKVAGDFVHQLLRREEIVQ